MGIRVKILPGGREETVDNVVSVGELLERLGLDSESHVVLVNGEPATQDTRLDEDDEVVVVRVLSGGKV